MKGDVGMAGQKVHKQGRIKVMVNIQSLIHPYIFSQKSKDVRIRLCARESLGCETTLLRPKTRQRLAIRAHKSTKRERLSALNKL